MNIPRLASPARPSLRVLLAVPALTLGIAAPVHALWQLGQGEVFLEGSASVSHDSNFRGNQQETSDTILSFSPSITYDRSRGRGTITAKLGTTFERFDEFTSQDDENYRGSLDITLPSAPGTLLQGSFRSSFFYGSDIDEDLNNRVETKRYNLGANGSYQGWNKVGLRFGANFARSEPDFGSDYTSWSLRTGLGYRTSADKSYFLDYRYSWSESEYGSGINVNSESTAHSVIVGVDGEITQKISGRIGVGVTSRDSENEGFGPGVTQTSDNDTSLVVDADISWAMRQNTSLSFGASHDIRGTSIGETALQTSFNASINQKIGQRISANLGLRYSMIEYDTIIDRQTDIIGGTLGASYEIGDYTSLNASYGYSQSYSSDPNGDYTRSVWRGSVSVRF